MTTYYCEPLVMYEVGISVLTLQFTDGTSLDVTPSLKNGRASYILFENLVAHFTGLQSGSQGGLSDLVHESGLGYEVKSYRDPAHLKPGPDLFHTAASSTFGPNNHGPQLKALLQQGDYPAAMEICRNSGYNKNAFYVYTNTSDYAPVLPFKYFIVPTAAVIASLSPRDPRLVSRSALLALLKSHQRIQ